MDNSYLCNYKPAVDESEKRIGFSFVFGAFNRL